MVSTPRRVALDLSCLEIRPETGVERYARSLTEHLAKVLEDEDPPLEVFAVVRPDAPTPAVCGRVSILTVPSMLPRVAWREAALPRALAREGVELLHSPVAALPLRGRFAVSATIHDLPPLSSDAQPSIPSRHRLRAAYAARAAARVITPSLATRDSLVGRYPAAAERVRVVPHGVDPDFRPIGMPLHRARYGIHDGPYLLSVGTLKARKRPALVTAAFRRLWDAGHSGLQLVLAGEIAMPIEEIMASLDGHPAAEAVLLPGYAAREDLPDLYREASVVLMPSDIEGFGLPALEAMSCGRPLVTSDDPALLELTGEGALHVPRGEAEALGAAVHSLLVDEELAQRVGQAGIERAAGYSWEACARAHVAIWNEILAEA